MADIFQTTFSDSFFLIKIYWFPIEISLRFILKDPINNTPALVQVKWLGANQITSYYLYQVDIYSLI